MTDAEAALLATTRKQGNHLMASQKKIKYVSKVYNLYDLRNEWIYRKCIFCIGFDVLPLECGPTVGKTHPCLLALVSFLFYGKGSV